LIVANWAEILFVGCVALLVFGGLCVVLIVGAAIGGLIGKYHTIVMYDIPNIFAFGVVLVMLNIFDLCGYFHLLEFGYVDSVQLFVGFVGCLHPSF
jgi:hypothetical protein